MLEERAAVLGAIENDENYGIRDLVSLLSFRNEYTLSLLEAMEQEGLIYFPPLANNFRRKRGRPKRIPRLTVLGKQLLQDFEKCRRNIIQINENDVKRCEHQMSLRRLLEENNISPYQRFLELNEFAFNVRNSVIH